MEFLPFLLFGGVLAVCLWLMRQHGRQARPQWTRTQDWQDLRPCDSENRALTETLRQVESCADCEYSVTGTRRGDWAGAPVYFARMTRRRNGHEVTMSVLLAQVARRDDHAALYLKPSTFTGSRVARTLEAMTPDGWDVPCDALRPLDLDGLDSRDLVGLQGPPDTSAARILDAAALQAVHGAGDAGALKLVLHGSWCLFLLPSPHLPVDLELLRPVVRALAERRETETETELAPAAV